MSHTILVPFLGLLSLSQACFWSSRITREDCEDFDRINDGCDAIYQGRLQAAEMSADLYKVKFELNFRMII